MTHWNYILLWHIDFYLINGDTQQSIFKLYSHCCASSAESEKSAVLNKYLDSLHDEPSASDDPSSSNTPQKLHSDPSPGLRLRALSKIYEISTQNADPSGPGDLRQDKGLILFYQKLLQLKLVNLSLQPLFRIVASSELFFPNYPMGEVKTAQFIHECVTLSPDGSLLLSVKRNQKNDHFLCITSLNNSTNSSSFIPYLKSVYTWKNERGVRDVVLSRDLHYLGVSYHVGYVEVHDLGLSESSTFRSEPVNHQVTLNGSLEYARSTLCLFHSQYPSSISYLALSANCEVLFLRSQRLGGLIIVNLMTGDVIDIPHYRLDLSMSLQFNDKVLLLSGWNETIIYGRATPASPNFTPKPGSLWEYYTSMIQAHISSYVPIEKAIALEKQNAYLGFDCSQTGKPVFKIILDEDEDEIEFTPLEKIGVEEEEGEEEDTESSEAEEDTEGVTEDLVSFSPTPSNTSAVDQTDQSTTPNAEAGGDDEDEDDDQDPDEADDRKSCILLSHNVLSLSELSYCLSSSGRRLAVVFQDRILLYVLRESVIDDALATGFLPHREFRVSMFKNIGNGKVSFVGDDKLLAITQDRIVIYELSSDSKWTDSGEQQVKYLKINADNNVELI